MTRRFAAALRRLVAGGGAPEAALPRFATPAEGFVMQPPRTIAHPERIHLGRDVKLGPDSVLKANVRYPGSWLRHPDGAHVEQAFDPVIRIGDRVTATAALQVVAFTSVTIEDDVLFAANVFVADGTHAMTRGDVPYKYQGIGPVAPVRIGRGSWIGQNVVIMPGTEIGELCVVGANSVVTKSLPARSVAVGAPARVVKCWSDEDGAWHDA